MSRRRKTSNLTRNISSLLLVSMLLPSMTGCSRRFWRQQAERDTYNAVGEKLSNERWQLPRINITPDSRSRFFDPYDPDYAPLPPDDPAAHEFMHCANGHEGYKCWHKFGDTLSVENPHWIEPYTDLLDYGDPVKVHSELEIPTVNLTDSLELAYIHSRDYQTNIEDVYLSALTLTEQRYLLGTRFRLAAPGAGGFLYNGALTKKGAQRKSSGLGVQQFLPGGGTIIVDLINTVTWNVGSGKTTATNLAWSISQPLLVDAGRKVNLEALTQSERNLLYGVRTMARFRRIIFSDVATDYLQLQATKQNIINRQNNIRQIEEQIEIAQVEDMWNPDVVREPLSRFPPDAEIPESLRAKLKFDGEYLIWSGLLNDEEKAAMLAISDDELFQSSAQQLIRWRETQVVSLGVLQLLTQLNETQNTVEGFRRQLADQLDNFKIRLGLPPDVDMTVDDSFLRPFELIDNRLLGVVEELKDFAKSQGPGLIPAPANVRTSERLRPEFGDLKKYVATLGELTNKIRQIGLEQVKQDFIPVREILDATSDDPTAVVDGRSFASKEERDRVIRDVARDLRLYRLNERDFERYSQLVDYIQELLQVEDANGLMKAFDTNGDNVITSEELPKRWTDLPRIGQLRRDDDLSADDLTGLIRDAAVQIREELLQIAQSLEVVQAGLRVEVIALNRFELTRGGGTPSIQEVVEIGLENRLDLMNARAEVMDSRRDVEIAANALKSLLDVDVRGGVDLDGGPSDDVDLTVNFKTPLDHVAQRNDYDRALVVYQRARRNYMRLEDGVKQGIRASWRQLQVSEQRLEIDRQTVRNAALEYDNVATGVGQNNNLSLLRALESVLTAQNALVRDWVTYETNRLNIFRDMGIMQINEEGIWDDSFYLRDGPGVNDTSPLPYGLIQDDIENPNLPPANPLPPAEPLIEIPGNE